ncbi:MAG: hypothetical protein ACAH10_10920 [Methylophilaceae bacterium]
MKNALWLVAIAGTDVWCTGVADCTLTWAIRRQDCSADRAQLWLFG